MNCGKMHIEYELVYLFYNLSRAQSCHYLEEFCKYTERLILNYLIKMSLKHPK